MKRNRLTTSHLVDLALAARDRVAESWTRGAQGRRAPDPAASRSRVGRLGASVSPTSPEAVAWCMVGAIRVEAPSGWRNNDIVRVMQQAFDRSGVLGHTRYKGGVTIPNHIQGFNDGGTQEKAVGAFDELARWLKDTEWEPPEVYQP